MRVSAVQVQATKGGQELSALLDGSPIWFRFPEEYVLAPRGDPFLAASLLPAMLQGEALEIDPRAPVSPRLLGQVAQLQEIFHCWNPRFGLIPVRASQAAAQPANEGVASFFSGGVDASYTFLRHAEDISHLIFLHGYDIQLENRTLFEQALEANGEFACRSGKKLVAVATNARSLCYPNTSFCLTCYGGCLLAAVGLSLSFPRTYIAASHTYTELTPWGSHLLTDPLWSTEATAFLHDGAAAPRSEKLRRVAASEAAMQILRVCLSNQGYNCGRCKKCLRTMCTLRALGLQSPALPPLTSVEAVRRLRVEDGDDLLFFLENVQLAARSQDRALAGALRGCVRRYTVRKGLAEIDRWFLGGRLKKVAAWLGRRREGEEWDRLAERVTFHPRGL
jgi:hypothetical protein